MHADTEKYENVKHHVKLGVRKLIILISNICQVTLQSRVLLEKPKTIQLIHKFYDIYGT